MILPEQNLVKHGVYYPLKGCFRLSIDITCPPGCLICSKWNGEYRPPLKGEWYLSGSIVETYQAQSNLTGSFHIAGLVRLQEVRTFVEIEDSLCD
jgi:hypothetical protein